MGWGAVMDDTSTGGRWSPSEAENHIDCLELLAAPFCFTMFSKFTLRKACENHD